MGKNAKAKVTEAVTETKPEAEVVKAPVAKTRIARGAKYDGKTLDTSIMGRKLVVGKNPPKQPRNPARPSVMYRLFSIVAENPGITEGKLIDTMMAIADQLRTHPSEYTRKESEQVNPVWVRDYIKGAVAARHLSVAE